MRRISNINIVSYRRKNIKFRKEIKFLYKNLKLFASILDQLNYTVQPKYKVINGKIEYGL